MLCELNFLAVITDVERMVSLQVGGH